MPEITDPDERSAIVHAAANCMKDEDWGAPKKNRWGFSTGFEDKH